MNFSEAREEAAKALLEFGFQEEGGIWRGKIYPLSLSGVDVQVKLPDRFPQKLPKIALESLTQIPRQMAHVQPDRFICVAATTGVLIDASNPRGLVKGVIDRAIRILERGASGESDPELYAEFLSYWGWGCNARVGSILTLQGKGRALRCFMQTPNPLQVCNGILATNLESAKTWAANLGSAIESSTPAYILALSSPIRPPMAKDQLFAAGDFLSELRNRVSSGDWQSFERWLRTVILPATVAFSFSLPDDLGSVIAAIVLPSKNGDVKGGGNYLFRPGQHRASSDLSEIATRPIERLQVDRFDATFLVPRAGGDVNLLAYSCAIIGIGSLGSRVAEFLAGMGVGTLNLIDGEALTNENIHRHALGIQDVSQFKASAMAQYLKKKFPHLTFHNVTAPIEEQLKMDEGCLRHFDIVINATGDETLGLELNEILHPMQTQIHTWLDPLGIGGHVLYVPPAPARGCFRCLFKDDPSEGLYNGASFAERGQDFTKSFSGCAGVFTPFSNLDSVRTAVEAARLCSKALIGKSTVSTLLSWKGDVEAFERKGFRLSKRAILGHSGCVLEASNFAQQDCPICGENLEIRAT